MARLEVVTLHVLRAVLQSRSILHQAVDIVPADQQHSTPPDQAIINTAAIQQQYVSAQQRLPATP
jgi:hypothetical protein